MIFRLYKKMKLAFKRFAMMNCSKVIITEMSIRTIDINNKLFKKD